MPDRPKNILVLHKTLQEVRELLSQNKKINAIKVLRSDYADLYNESLGLREAKFGVERLAAEEKLGTSPGLVDLRSPVINVTLTVKKVEVEAVGGPVWVDLEELQLRILNKMGTIGLEEAGRLLELVEVFQAWNDGKKVGVIEND